MCVLCVTCVYLYVVCGVLCVCVVCVWYVVCVHVCVVCGVCSDVCYL